MLKWAGKVLLSLVVLFAVGAVSLGGYRAWRQHESERVLAIATPNGIDEALFLSARVRPVVRSIPRVVSNGPRPAIETPRTNPGRQRPGDGA